MEFNYCSSLELKYRSELKTKVTTKIPRELWLKIVGAGLSISYILRQGIYKLISDGLLIIDDEVVASETWKSITSPDRMKELQSQLSVNSD